MPTPTHFMQRKTAAPKRTYDFEMIRSFLVAVGLALLLRSFVVEPFHIPSGSMKDGLLVGDYLFVTKFSYGYSRYSFPFGPPIFHGRIPDVTPSRGDVVVFRLPRDPSVDYIKRVIGLPGDQIQVRNGILYLNGQAVPRTPTEPYVDNEDPNNIVSIPRFTERLPGGAEYTVLDQTRFGEVDNTPTYTVPEGHYFMMGDNRDNSTDSRFMNQVGFVPAENLVGKAQIILLSTDGSAQWWEFWRWIPSLRSDRFFKTIH